MSLENASWLGYSIDSLAPVTIAGNTTLTGLTEGSHNIIIYATNSSGQIENSNIIYFNVNAPTLTPTPSPSPSPSPTLEPTQTASSSPTIAEFPLTSIAITFATAVLFGVFFRRKHRNSK